MKITAIRTYRAEEFANVLWVHVETDAGITGLGETFYGAEACEAHIHNTLAVRLLGQNPLNIEALHKEMVSLPNAQASTGVEYRAASAIDIALWDIFGKVAGQPVHVMLGGQSWDRVRVYNTCAGTRKAVGDRMEIMVELHCLWNLPVAKDIARVLEDYQPRWYEDPIRMNNAQALAEFAASTSVWTCASETLGSRFAYKEFLDRNAAHVVMADLCWTGGLTEGRKIAAMADTYHRPFAPHDCIGPVGFAAAIHMSFSQPNTLIQESVRAFYNGWYRELVTEVPRIEGGYVYPMEGPGLGTELRPDFFDRGDLTTRISEVS